MAITIINDHLLFDFIHLLFMTKVSVWLNTMNKDNGNNSILNLNKKEEAVQDHLRGPLDQSEII